MAAYADEEPTKEELEAQSADPLGSSGHKVVDRTGHYYAHIEAERQDSSVATPVIAAQDREEFEEFQEYQGEGAESPDLGTQLR